MSRHVRALVANVALTAMVAGTLLINWGAEQLMRWG